MLAVLDELVGPADAHHRRGEAQVAQLLQHGAAEAAAENVVFERQDHIDAAREELQHLDVDRLGEAGVDHRRGDALAFELAGDFLGHGHQRAQREDGDAVVIAVLQQFGLADREWRGERPSPGVPGPTPRG